MDNNAVRMTEGSIAGHLVRFAGPVFLGNMFQQLYNLVDSLIVGNFAGDDALAAVSSSGGFIFLIVGFIFGLFGGAGVIIARYFGAGDEKGVHDSIHTTIALSIVCGVMIILIGVFGSPFILRLMGTPSRVFPNSVTYFRIYFMGGIAICLFNASSGIYQAVGNSRAPVYFLMTASIVNVILDLLLVGVLEMGVAGAAMGTVISQCISVFLAYFSLMRSGGIYAVRLKDIGFSMDPLREILSMGIPTGIQNSVIGIANTFVQANINAFGEIAMAGCGCYSRIEAFVLLPITSFSIAITTFISQNMGAGRKDRVKLGARFGIIACVFVAELVGVGIFIFIPVLMGMFSKNPDVITAGVTQARVESLFYFLLACSHAQAGILRGKGKSVVPMLVMLGVWCILRVSYISVMVWLFPVIHVVFTAYPLTWGISTLIYALYLKLVRD